MTDMLGRTLTFCLLAVTATPAISAARGASSLELSAPALSAVTTATDRFKADGNKMDGYRLMIFERRDGIEVVFVPELIKSSNMVGFEKSARPEVHYYLDASGSAIQKVLLGQ